MRRPFPHAPLVVGLLAIVVGVSPAQNQIQYRPTPGGVPPPQTQSYARPTGATVVAAPTYVPAPTYGYPGYPTIQGPVAGRLNGTANVISAYGQYSMDVNQARLTNQQVEQEKLRTRRMIADQDRYERSLQPTANQAAAAKRATDLQLARNNPPSVLIWSGSTLNDLLGAIQDAQTKTGVKGPAVPLDSATLMHINVNAAGMSRGPVSMLRQGGRLRWPFSLQTDPFTQERQKIDQLMPQAVKEIQGDGLQRATYESLNTAVGELKDKITASAPDLPLSEIISAKGYAEQVGDLVRVLKDPSAVNYFNGTWEAKGNSVAELVDNMSRGGLTFAPAAEPDRPFYSSLYRSLLSYDSGIVQLVSR